MADSVKINASGRHTNVSFPASSSTEASSSSIKSKPKKNNRRRRFSFNGLQNNSQQSNYLHQRSLQNLMSINTMEAAEYSNNQHKIRPLMYKPVNLSAWNANGTIVSNIPVPINKKAPFIIQAQSTAWKPARKVVSNIPVPINKKVPFMIQAKSMAWEPTANSLPNTLAQTRSKKVPFIIQAQSSGHASSRTVMLNPEFAGYSNRNNSKANEYSIVRKRVRAIDDDECRTATLCGRDLRNVVANKRKPIISIESIPKSEEKKELPMSIASEEMSDEDKRYLMEIEKQKIKREEIIRQKEWRRNEEGWEFLNE